MFGPQHLQRAAQWCGVGHMAINNEQASHTAVVSPVTYLFDKLDQQNRRHGDGAGPSAAMPQRTTIGQRWQHGHAGGLRDRSAQRLGDHRVDTAAQVRAVLLGRANG